MAKWDYTGVHGLNKYIWKRIQDELGWVTSDYGGLTPITTPQQQPEFNAFDKPYIVYGYTLQGTNTLFPVQGEVVTYTVFSTQSADIRKAVNLINSALNRFDESARDVNNYIAANGSDDNKAFDYKFIRVNQATGPEPAVTEGGRQDGSVIVSMEYTHYGSNGELIRL
jgi:hypothetical protein